VPYVAVESARCLGSVIGSGQCVAYVREVTGLPPTSYWRRGAPVRTSSLASGTAIATFTPAGLYSNSTSGDSHAAILLEVQADGLAVLDQWRGQPVHQRVIRYRGGQGDAVNDGDRFYVIEIEEVT